jgi:methionyl-tRNA formyltransferase
MRIVFMGTPALAVPCLDELAKEHEIVAVVTQPDKPAGRGHNLVAPPVKQRALELGIPVLQPERARNEDFVAELATYAPDAIAVVAFGQILPRAILDLGPKGCVNLHYSLLPRWRGAAPVQYAIWHGDTETGVTTQFMAEKLDAGDVIQQIRVPIEPQETSGELLERLNAIGSGVLRDTMRLLEGGRAPRTPQDEAGVTLAPTIKKEFAELAWASPASKLHNTVRAMNPWPTAWFTWNGDVVKVWRAEVEPNAAGQPGQILEHKGSTLLVGTGEGALRLLEVQPPGKPRMGGGDWARGARLEVGGRL